MTVRFAFMGFRHPHITAMYAQARDSAEIDIVATCEEHAPTRKQLTAAGTVSVTHDDYGAMLDSVECDVIAIGDYYSKRGALAIEALERGKHVIADKPLCTSLAEFDELARLAADRGAVVGCMLDQRDSCVIQGVRNLLQQDVIGEVHAVFFGGQHPLMYGTRPEWYFEPGKHGGTINDIAIHALDSIPWMTGLRFTCINAARNWNAGLRQVPHFKDSAQVMLTMNNGCGVMGDVSYLMPDSFGYSASLYWRMTFWGQNGVIEASQAARSITLYRNGEDAPRDMPLNACPPAGYLRGFLQEINGKTDNQHLSSAAVLRATRVALLAQDAADSGRCNVPVP